MLVVICFHDQCPLFYLQENGKHPGIWDNKKHSMTDPPSHHFRMVVKAQGAAGQLPKKRQFWGSCYVLVRGCIFYHCLVKLSAELAEKTKHCQQEGWVMTTSRAQIRNSCTWTRNRHPPEWQQYTKDNTSWFTSGWHGSERERTGLDHGGEIKVERW